MFARTRAVHAIVGQFKTELVMTKARDTARIRRVVAAPMELAGSLIIVPLVIFFFGSFWTFESQLAPSSAMFEQSRAAAGEARSIRSITTYMLPEGTRWTEGTKLRIGDSITFAVPELRHRFSLAIQVDANDRYRVFWSSDGSSFRELWTVPKARGSGLRTRKREFSPPTGPIRQLRVMPVDSILCPGIHLTHTTAVFLAAAFKPSHNPHKIGTKNGYIGCELAQMFARASVHVTIVTRSRLLSDSEPEISEALTQYFRDEGITVLDSLSYDRIEKTPSGIGLSIHKDGRLQVIEAEQVLASSGRAPNIEGLGLEAAGVVLNGHGGIKIDDHMRTSKPGVYAAGDVTAQDQFVYMAAYGAKIASQNALNGDSLKYDRTVMPAVVFTDPLVASVGLTQAQAKAIGYKAKTTVLDLKHVPRALAARDTRGLIKLVADANTKRLLGAHIIAPEGADSIQTAAIAIFQGMTFDDLAQMIFPYLTTVEGLKLAAQTFDKDVTKLSCCAG